MSEVVDGAEAAAASHVCAGAPPRPTIGRVAAGPSGQRESGVSVSVSVEGVPRPARRPTITDVARQAGVSRGTVSRVLNARSQVSAETRAAVEQAMAEAGYRVNTMARGLRTGSTHRVAFLLNEGVSRLFAHPNLPVIVQHCSDALGARGSSMLLLMAGSDEERRRAIEFIDAGAVDGVLVLSWNADPDILTRLEATGVPTVSCGAPRGYEGPISWTGADDREGAARAAGHLLAIGRRTLVAVTGSDDLPGGDQRRAGFLDVIGRDLDPRRVVAVPDTREAAERVVATLLADVPDLDGVLCGNDVMAAWVVEVLQRHGRRVPEDVAVVGFDDSSAALSSSPPLTTMRQDFAEIAATMVLLLSELVEGRPPRSVVVPTELVVRGSTVG